jgi:hypothetical protein
MAAAATSPRDVAVVLGTRSAWREARRLGTGRARAEWGAGGQWTRSWCCASCVCGKCSPRARRCTASPCWTPRATRARSATSSPVHRSTYAACSSCRIGPSMVRGPCACQGAPVQGVTVGTDARPGQTPQIRTEVQLGPLRAWSVQYDYPSFQAAPTIHVQGRELVAVLVAPGRAYHRHFQQLQQLVTFANSLFRNATLHTALPLAVVQAGVRGALPTSCTLRSRTHTPWRGACLGVAVPARVDAAGPLGGVSVCARAAPDACHAAYRVYPRRG